MVIVHGFISTYASRQSAADMVTAGICRFCASFIAFVKESTPLLCHCKPEHAEKDVHVVPDSFGEDDTARPFV